MKELSIEEKAKRYDEAFEIAKEINNEQRAQPFNVMTRVFPELKESEDERIRKELIERFKWELKGAEEQDAAGCSRQKDIAMFKRGIAWLEKQGEQKPAWSEEDEKTIVKMRDFFIGVLGDRPDFTEDKRYEEFIEFIDNRLKSLKPNHWKPSEEQMNALSSAGMHPSWGAENCKILQSLYSDLQKL